MAELGYENLTYTILPRRYGDANRQILKNHFNRNIQEQDAKLAEIPGGAEGPEKNRYKYAKKSRDSKKGNYNTILEKFNSLVDTVRNIVVRTIPKGTVLYHYYDRKTYASQDTNWQRPYTPQEKLIHYYSRFAFQEISYNHKEDTVTFKLSRSLVNPKYYFGVPFVVYGLNQPHMQYNTMIPVVVKEDIHLAYLQSGSEVPIDSTMHRLYPSTYFNFQRIASCGNIQSEEFVQCEGNSCGTGSASDACLRKQFADEYSIDGVTGIANNDSLYSIEKETGKIQNFPQQLQDELLEYNKILRYRPNEIQVNIFNTIMMALAQDSRPKLDLIGFTEYAIHPFGKKGYKGEHFLPPPTDDVYEIIEEVPGERQTIKTSFANFQRVYKTYIEPNLIVNPICIVDNTSNDPTDTVFLPDSPTFMDRLHRRTQVAYHKKVDHVHFFNWLRTNSFHFIYNPMLNLYGISKDGFPYSYPIQARYKNGFEVNQDSPYKDQAILDFTNVPLGKLVHFLTKPDYTLNTGLINSLLEAKIFKSWLHMLDNTDMDVCLYNPVWNPDRPVGATPVFVVAGPFLEVDLGYLKTAFTEIYKGLVLPYGMEINDKLFNHIFASKNGGNYYYLGTILPPPVENQNKDTNLANINTGLFKGGRGRGRGKYPKTRRQQRRLKRRCTRRTK